MKVNVASINRCRRIKSQIQNLKHTSLLGRRSQSHRNAQLADSGHNTGRTPSPDIGSFRGFTTGSRATFFESRYSCLAPSLKIDWSAGDMKLIVTALNVAHLVASTTGLKASHGEFGVAGLDFEK